MQRCLPLGVTLLLGLAACGHLPITAIPPSAETISLLGDTLWSVPVPVPEGRWRVQRLQDARDQFARARGRLQAALELARATAGLGRFREAIRVFGEAAALGPTDPRPYLGRGELFLRLREFDRALADLRLAHRLNRGRPLADADPRPDGTLAVRSIGFEISFHLGFLYFLTGEAELAMASLAQAAAQAELVEDAARAAFWYGVAAGTGGRGAFEVLPEEYRTVPVPPLLALLQLLEAPDSGSGNDCSVGRPRTEAAALECYLVGRRRLLAQQSEEARAAFRQVRRLPDWSQDVALAAEAELARLDR